MKTLPTFLLCAGFAGAALLLSGCSKSDPVLPTPPATPTQTSAATAAAKVKPYPLTTCPVSGEKLGEMGEPVSFVYQGQEIKLCCKNCRKDFDKDPAKFLSKLAK